MTRHEQYSLYWLLVEDQIFFNNNLEDISLLHKMIKHTFDYVDNDLFKRESTKDLQNKALIALMKTDISNEEKKEYYCYFLNKNITLNLKDNEVWSVYEKYKFEDFSEYYDKYPVIRDFYDAEDVQIKEIITTKFTFNHSVQANNLSISPIQYQNALSFGHNFIEKKASEVSEIESFYEQHNSAFTKTYINYYNKTESVNSFINKYLMFIQLLANETRGSIKIKETQLEDIWNNVLFFEDMDSKTPNKKDNIKKKKV